MRGKGQGLRRRQMNITNNVYDSVSSIYRRLSQRQVMILKVMVFLDNLQYVTDETQSEMQRHWQHTSRMESSDLSLS